MAPFSQNTVSEKTLPQSVVAVDYTLPENKDRLKRGLEHLFTPFIRVIPEQDWSKIKAIWIPFLHHDYKNKLEKSDTIKIINKSVDRFGTVQGYLFASNENYIPYLTTFFNPELTRDAVIEKIMQAHCNILTIEQTIIDPVTQKSIQSSAIGVAKSGMLLSLIINKDNTIIDAFPIFHKEQS